MREKKIKVGKKLLLFKYFLRSKYRSLKHENYFNIYSSLFQKYRNKKIIFVEVGVANGGSLFMWRNFFGKRAKIIGIDFNPAAKKWEKYGFKIFIGNQSDPIFWKNFFKKIGYINILLDDGGHTNEQMINTFNSCYKNIRDDGLILFEDTHASYMKEFGNPSKYSFVNFCYSVIDKINLNYFGKRFLYNYQDIVYNISFYQSIAVFFINRKKTKKSVPVDNGGVILNAEDYRFRDSSIISIIELNKNFFRKLMPNRLYDLLKKFYPIIKFMNQKFMTRKNKKYFN